MNEFNPLDFVAVDDRVIAIDYPAIIAAMTGTEAADWREIDRPVSGVGVEYHFTHPAGFAAYAVLDQTHVSVSVTDADDSEAETLEFDPPL